MPLLDSWLLRWTPAIPPRHLLAETWLVERWPRSVGLKRNYLPPMYIRQSRFRQPCPNLTAIVLPTVPESPADHNRSTYSCSLCVPRDLQGPRSHSRIPFLLPSRTTRMRRRQLDPLFSNFSSCQSIAGEQTRGLTLWALQHALPCFSPTT